MSGPYHFGLGPGHLSRRAERIADRLGADLLNHTEPDGRKRHWFNGPNQGAPWDERFAREVLAAVRAGGTARDRELMGEEGESDG